MLGHPHAFEAPPWGTALSAFFPTEVRSQPLGARPHLPRRPDQSLPASVDTSAFDDDTPVEWSEEDVVFLHWRLLQEVNRLADPATPLEEKFDTLRWVFTERAKDGLPFSFASCLRVVGCSPLSPIAYCGLIDVEEVRDRLRRGLRAWLPATLHRYPDWVRDAVASNPEWIEARLERNPQWINEQLKRMADEGDLFA
jgi:hypothetical protein